MPCLKPYRRLYAQIITKNFFTYNSSTEVTRYKVMQVVHKKVYFMLDHVLYQTNLLEPYLLSLFNYSDCSETSLKLYYFIEYQES